MRKFFKISMLLSFFVILMVRCKNDNDAYFGRPSWLEPPIYEVLQNKGHFTNYLKCVDRTIYAASLKEGGLYTVFAPTDSAFKVYLNAHSISSVDNLPDTTVNKIVSYSLLNNSYTFENLTSVLTNGWDSLSSIRKRTAYYETIYPMVYQGNNIWVYDAPGSSLTIGTTVEQNNKFVPLYISPVFESSRTHEQAVNDYSMFYSSDYTGQNVQSASITTKDMIAENGVVHEINQVLEPLPNLEKMLNDPDFSTFKGLINMSSSTGTPYFISYTYSDALTKYFNSTMPEKNISQVYIKYYSGLPFSLSGERFGTTTKQAEGGGYTIFAPNNTAVNKFYEDKLKSYYPDGISSVSKDILSYFINAQMIDDLVWPGDYKGSMNSLGEFFNGKGSRGSEFDKTKYSKIAPASNGLFYGSNDYVKSRYFETVFTEILLNPKNSLLLDAFNLYYSSSLQDELLKCELNGYTQENYTILMPSDSLLQADGFSYGWLSSSNSYGFTNSNSGSTLGNFDAATRLQRLIKSHIFKRLKNDDVNCALTSFTTDPAFASAYGGYSYAVNMYGDMVRYYTGSDGKQYIQMLGNYDESDWVVATPYKTFTNGQIFKVNKMLQYSRRNTYPSASTGYTTQALLTYLQNMATVNTNITTFVSYLTQCMTGDGSTEISGLSSEAIYTLFIPGNAAMTKAINAGDLPAYSLLQSGDVTAKQKATKFILYHIVKGKVFVDDGLKYIMPNDEVLTEETWPTALKDVVDNTYLSIRKDASGRLLVSTKSLSTGKAFSNSIKTATVTRGVKRSNFFGAKAVIHEISDYFTYSKVQ